MGIIKVEGDIPGEVFGIKSRRSCLPAVTVKPGKIPESEWVTGLFFRFYSCRILFKETGKNIFKLAHPYRLSRGRNRNSRGDSRDRKNAPPLIRRISSFVG